MDTTLTINEALFQSNFEIQNMCNETCMDILVTEYSFFKDITLRAGVLEESVINEGIADKAKFIGKKIKDFFVFIGRAIAKFFKFIIDKISGLFSRTKVSEDGEKLDLSSANANDISKDINTAVSSVNKTASTSGSNVTKSTKIEEPKSTPKVDIPQEKKVQVVKQGAAKVIKPQKMLLLEKNKGLFEVMKNKFRTYSKWLSTNYTGEETKLGTIDFAYNKSWSDNDTFKTACANAVTYVSISLKRIEDGIKMDNKEKISKSYEKAADRFSSYAVDGAIYDNLGISDLEGNFETRWKKKLGIDNIVDVTSKSLKNEYVIDSVLNDIFDKNRVTKQLKKDYNSYKDTLGKLEQRISEFNDKYGEYGKLSDQTVANMMRYTTKLVNYFDRAQAINTTTYANRRKNAMSIYNNTIALYNRTHND